MREKEAKAILHINYSNCLKCQKAFKVKDEIIFLNKSRVIHKKCYEEFKKMIQEEKNV